ncbi:hypothetical protein OKA05_15165 [Luteolibacter arcticus]|uniref:Uncharacterized protein n=1 Tax=Luteolibacter arcticus TaxID=1581411 RepID=A0ABT3GK53_9BACT|nr:hypothetical protein [Luteolibacter arcticus]MCW1923907.1 hypothetical protein [Luteolibacter arcticus]
MKTYLRFVSIFGLLGISLAASAQTPGAARVETDAAAATIRTAEIKVKVSATVTAARTIEIRAVLQDPTNPDAVLQVRTPSTGLNKLDLIAEGLSAPRQIEVVNNTISIYGPSPADPKVNPPVLATAVIPAEVHRCILVVAPTAAGAKVPYHLLAVDDSAGAFPFGESRVINLTTAQMGMQAGATRLSLPAGKVTSVPMVKDLNEYHMGQTNFYAMAAKGKGKEWMPFVERQVQYLKTLRRIFIIHVTPGAIAPAVRTVVDHEPFKLPTQTAKDERPPR